MLLNELQQVPALAAALDQRLHIAGNVTRHLQIEDVGFIYGTMWTDFNGGDPASEQACRQSIHDFRAIVRWFDTTDRITPADLAQICRASLRDIELMLKENARKGLRSVVVTHHMPSHALVHEQYKRDHRSLLLNGAFAVNADRLIGEHLPVYWLYGHTHTPTRARLADTWCICNPYGYPEERNLAENRYHPGLVIEL